MVGRRNSNPFVKVLILAVILILPGFLYYLLEKEGKNSYVTLPVYGEKTLTGTFSKRMGKEIPDTAYHLVPAVRLRDQTGGLVDFPVQDTSISVVNFFYTRCESFCKHMNDEMNRVANRFARNAKVRFYSMTVDTLYDMPAVLEAYGAGYQPETKKWMLLTSGGAGGDVLETARRGFLVDAVQDTTRENAFIHSSSLILMDSRRRIRGYYDVNHPKEVDRLIDEIKLLLVEEIRLRSPY